MSNISPNLHPFCNICGWRKGGLDSWNGTTCKCGHSEPPIVRTEPLVPWIVMTSSAKMPSSVKSAYRNVALVRLTEEYRLAGLRPSMISTRARGVMEVRPIGKFFVGKTQRAAYQIALAGAQEIADNLNAAEATRLALEGKNAPEAVKIHPTHT
jgi:hypothetical protein